MSLLWDELVSEVGAEELKWAKDLANEIQNLPGSPGEEFSKDVAALFCQYHFESRERESGGQNRIPLVEIQERGKRLAKASEQMIAALSEFGATSEYFLLQMYSSELVEAIGAWQGKAEKRESLLKHYVDDLTDHLTMLCHGINRLRAGVDRLKPKTKTDRVSPYVMNLVMLWERYSVEVPTAWESDSSGSSVFLQVVNLCLPHVAALENAADRSISDPVLRGIIRSRGVRERPAKPMRKK